MSPLNHNLEGVTSDEAQAVVPQVSDMRRVSLSLAFNPARQRRRTKMEQANWFGKKLGIHLRRAIRS